MSLYLPEQKLGSHSTEGGKSNKFVLKGRQTGAMHRGHTWVFRAESHDTMMAWYEDIRALTERSAEERSNFLRGHSRSFSRTSQRSSLSSDGIGDDDEEPPFTTNTATVSQQPRQDNLPRRPSGGRFPSDLSVDAQRGLQVPVSPLSVSSGYSENADGRRVAAAESVIENSTGRDIHPNAASVATSRQEANGSNILHQLESVRSFDAPPPAGKTPAEGVRDETSYIQVVHRTPPNADLATNNQYHSPPRVRMSQGDIPGIDGSDLMMGVNSNTRMLRSALNSVDDAEATTNGSYADGRPRRPEATPHGDASTMSHLHIPGEYPRGSSIG